MDQYLNTIVQTSPENYFSGDLWIVGAVSLVLILTSVLLHYEGLRIFTRMLAGHGKLPRIRILYLVFGLIILHIVEILIFAAAYFMLSRMNLGQLQGLESDQFFMYFYYSAEVYTTLGFGDIIPLGALKILTAMESLIGLAFITWSASFTFLEMQKYWKIEDE